MLGTNSLRQTGAFSVTILTLSNEEIKMKAMKVIAHDCVMNLVCLHSCIPKHRFGRSSGSPSAACPPGCSRCAKPPQHLLGGCLFRSSLAFGARGIFFWVGATEFFSLCNPSWSLTLTTGDEQNSLIIFNHTTKMGFWSGKASCWQRGVSCPGLLADGCMAQLEGWL